MEGKLYRKENQYLYTALNKACNKSGLPWVYRHWSITDTRSVWEWIRDFYYSNNITDNMKKKYKAQFIKVKYHSKSWFTFENLV